MEKKRTKHPEKDAGTFRFLADAALAAGAVAAKIIPADRVTVEDRVRLKCRSGCPSYGKYLTCPPHSMTPGEFRACLREYRHVLIVKFQSAAVFDDNIRTCYLRCRFDPGTSPEQKESAGRFARESSEHNRSLNLLMLDLEKNAFNAGYPFAVTTFCGTCGLCESCNTATCICNHPTMRRFAPEAVGINVIKTAEDAGMPIRFPAPEVPERVAILLID
jgi:predicted metal-binding protein